MFKNKRGQSIVEFALVFPMFVFLTFGCLYIGIFMHDYMAMGELTREIARFEAVGTRFADIRDNLNINSRFTSMYKVDSNDPNDVIVEQFNDGALGRRVRVTVTMRRNSNVIRLVDAFMPNQISSTLIMRRE